MKSATPFSPWIVQNTSSPWGQGASQGLSGWETPIAPSRRRKHQTARVEPSELSAISTAIQKIGLEINLLRADHDALRADHNRVRNGLILISKKQDQIDSAIASYQRAVDRIHELAKLPANWDSYGADIISGISISTTMSLLLRLEDGSSAGCSALESIRFIAPLPDGGLQIEWQNGNRELELEIHGDGDIGFVILANSNLVDAWDADAQGSFESDRAIDLAKQFCIDASLR